ncbi:MAG TPA: alpha/beta fold hydrolase [Burkholderiales bacterium]
MRPVFVCGHGAGGHRDDRAMLASAAALERAGLEVVRFNFPYRDRGSRLPDRMPVLRERFAEAVAQARSERGGRKLIIGGRSMGGRVATMMAAEGFPCDALLLLAYPLHPAGKPDKLRDAHLPRITVPVLCFNGTRDALCRRDLMEAALRPVHAPWQMHWLEGSDHSLASRKALEEIAAVTQRWLDLHHLGDLAR